MITGSILRPILHQSAVPFRPAFVQIRTQGGEVQPPTGEFTLAVHQDRYEFVVAALEIGIRVNVDRLDREVQLSAQHIEGGEHVVAKVAVLPAVEDKSRSVVRRISHAPIRPLP
jgi:hypothetical protein